MPVTVSAPGKAVLLGEYAVLDGARALVLALDVRCRATLGRARGPRSRLTTQMPGASTVEFGAGEPSGSGLVDAALGDRNLAPPWPAFTAAIDTSRFFAGPVKLGLGSSAAALVAFVGAAWAAAGKPGRPPLEALIGCHRAFQGGRGSGIDVAAALTGGCIEFRLDPGGAAHVGSVRLPKSVGFAGIFAGGSASTPDLVGRYRRWIDSGSDQAAEMGQRLFGIAARGCAAVAENDGTALVAAIDEYGHALEALGRAMGADLVTAAHRQIGDLARQLGLAYKVSGAGGGDVGIACGEDPAALRSFSDKAADRGFRAIDLRIDGEGMVVEERAE